MKIKKGDKIAYRNVGYGLITYEGPDKVTRVTEDKLFTATFDSGMDRIGNEWVFDTGLGLRTVAIPYDAKAKQLIRG